MKKLLSTIAVLMLFISAIGAAFNFAPSSKADIMYYLEVKTRPEGIVTINGTGWYTDFSIIDLEAPPVVDVDGGKRYVFVRWNFDGINGTTNPHTTLNIDSKNRTATALYKTQYTFTFVTQYDTAWIQNVSSGVWYTEGDQDITVWFDEGVTAKAGLSTGLVEITPPSGWWAYADFQNFLGDVSGTGDHTTNPQHSSTVVIDSDKSASTNWTVNYWLATPDSVYNPWGWPSHVYNPGMTGYYLNCTYVDITAPEICPNSINPNRWRWRFDHWIVQKWNGTAWDPTTITDRTIVIHMGQPTIATIYFWLQYYITFNDDIGGYSCLSANSGYYDYCSDLPDITAPDYLNGPIKDSRWRWAYWKEDGSFLQYERTLSGYHVDHDAILTGCYHMQYFVRLDQNPHLGTIVQIKGSDIIGAEPIGGYFDAGAAIYFLVPDIAVLVPGVYMWQFDTNAGRQWWLNGIYWGLGGWWNASWRCACYGFLNQPINVTANYQRFFYLEWDTDPTFTPAVWKGNAWLPEGYTFWTGAPPGSVAPCWVFKQLFEDGVSKGIGVMSYLCTMVKKHTIIAEYVNKTTFTITSPGPFTAPKQCTNFQVTVWASNFDAERGRDLWGMDFKIYWNTTLINLVGWSYAGHLDNLWGVGKWFVAKEENGTGYLGKWDYFWFAATALKSASSHVGSKPVLTLTFHIELDPCYPTVYESPINFGEVTLVNSTNGPIPPELKYGATYSIHAPQPIVQIELSKTPIRLNNPQQTFDAFVNIKLGIKVTDFNFTITYPKELIEPVNITFGDYLPGPAFETRGYTFDKTNGKILVWAVQDPEESPHAYGNGTLFIIEFKVIKATFWPNPALTGNILIDGTKSYLSVCCPYPKKQWLNPDVQVEDVPYIYDPLPGDLNFDGVVNVADLRLLASLYGTNVGLPPPYKPYDLTGDGFVWLRDLVAVALHYGEHI